MASGINLIGYATSPTGLGEDLRSFASMLDHLGIAYSVTDVPTESSGKVRHAWQGLTQEHYTTSFFFMSPMECVRLAAAQPMLFAEGQTRVGYFLWELPDFPDEYVAGLQLVDQIWCPTRFVQQAFFAKTRKLTLAIPLPVITAARAGRDFCQELAIPPDTFVALYLFDVRSTLQRKNPEGTLQAFLRFADRHPDSYLVLKINRWHQVDRSQFAWLPEHPRIRLITETLDAGQLSDLYQAADVYLSLHRSEGFGRTLVEALQHGLRPICTRYSGPADFLDERNAYLVDWQSRPVARGDYPYTQGSTWSEPSISSAVLRLEEAYAARHQSPSAAALETGKRFTVAGLASRYAPILRTYVK